MIDRHLMKLRARDDVSAQEEQAIASAISVVKDYPADLTVIRRCEELIHSTLLLDGLMCRYKDLRNGERQICEIHVPGDFVDLHSFTLKHLDHNIMTLTPCRVALVPHERLRAITEEFPHLTRVYWFGTNLDAAIHREWELSLGRRSALSRTANFFCELHVRLGLVGLADDSGYDFPVTQIEMAECLGLTSVHVNRTLKELREQNAVDFRRGRVKLLDLAILRRIAEFDPAYLYLGRRQR
ncbi:Crp/Fnr family transcriptional regulator [Sphingobium sp. AN558]|uniref:Crp/Fnr family transcriptional regulator n=1 Tax=Sphingobium sp. AN558 TaxID=3133442 RepID=UPI0030C0C030